MNARTYLIKPKDPASTATARWVHATSEAQARSYVSVDTLEARIAKPADYEAEIKAGRTPTIEDATKREQAAE
jgi:hypothetical protein